MFHTPAHKQTDAHAYPAQVVATGDASAFDRAVGRPADILSLSWIKVDGERIFESRCDEARQQERARLIALRDSLPIDATFSQIIAMARDAGFPTSLQYASDDGLTPSLRDVLYVIGTDFELAVRRDSRNVDIRAI